jgi:hypothetical protein
VDYLLCTFIFLATGILVTLCLLVIEYQNSRTRRLNQIWSARLGALSTQVRPVDGPTSEQHAA